MIQTLLITELSLLAGLLIEPGAMVCHRNSPGSRGLVVAQVENEATVVWSVAPIFEGNWIDPKSAPKWKWDLPKSVYDHTLRWTPEEAEKLQREGHIKGYTLTKHHDDAEIQVELDLYEREDEGFNSPLDGARFSTRSMRPF